MAEINEDFLNDETDYELDTEVDEEALLGDGDDEETERHNNTSEQVDTNNDVELEIEHEDLLTETSEELKVSSELEEEYKGGRKEKFMSERKLITPPESHFDNSQNYDKRRSFQRTNNFRGTFRGRGRGYHNALRRNKTVLINPNFQGIVHVNNTNARLHTNPWAPGHLTPQPPIHVQSTMPQPQMNMHSAQRQPPVMQMHINTPNLYQQPMVSPQVYQPSSQNYACPPSQHPQPVQNMQMSCWDGQNQISYSSCDQFQYQHPSQQPVNMPMERQVFSQPPPPSNFQPMFNTAQPPPQVPTNQMVFENQPANFQHPNQQFQNHNVHYQNNYHRNNNFQNQYQGGYTNNNMNNNNNYQNAQQAVPQQQFVKRKFVKPEPFDQRKKLRFPNNTGRNDLAQNRLVRENRLALNVELKVEKPAERQQVITHVKVEDEPDEDPETKKLRLEIELQKKRREEILRWKEERRKQVMQENKPQSGVTPTVVVTHNVAPTRKPVQTVVRSIPQVKNLTPTFSTPAQSNPTVRQFPQNRQNFVNHLRPKQTSPNIVVTNGYSKRLSKYQKGAPKVINNVVNDNNRVVMVTNNVTVKNNAKNHLSSFLTDRKVLVKDESLINTRAVMIKNLSTNTTNKRILSMSKTIGEVENCLSNLSIDIDRTWIDMIKRHTS